MHGKFKKSRRTKPLIVEVNFYFKLIVIALWIKELKNC
jgi:hypothetical protein